MGLPRCSSLAVGVVAVPAFWHLQELRVGYDPGYFPDPFVHVVPGQQLRKTAVEDVNLHSSKL